MTLSQFPEDERPDGLIGQERPVPSVCLSLPRPPTSLIVVSHVLVAALAALPEMRIALERWRCFARLFGQVDS